MAKPLNYSLPADLPENWKLSDVVAPDGELAGLTKQHGYNYQSRQINSVHGAVNTLNDAMGEMEERINDLYLKVNLLWYMMLNDVVGNPFIYTFGTLDNVQFIKGIWHKEKERLEC